MAGKWDYKRVIAKRNCLHCNKEFDVIANNPQRKYCSKYCGRMYSYHKNREAELQRMKQWYKDHRDSEILTNAIYRQQNKDLFDWYHNKERFSGKRNKVLERDGNCCVSCGMEDNLNVHHKDGLNAYNSESPNNEMDNLITLCSSCHHRLHHWQRREHRILTDNEEIINTLALLYA